MSAAARSIYAYAIYLFAEGLALLLIPSFALSIFGLPEPVGIWVRIVGMTVVFFSLYYFLAARNEFRPFFALSVATRLSVPVIFLAFIAAGLAPWNLLLFTPFDILFSAWTWLALRSSGGLSLASAS